MAKKIILEVNTAIPDCTGFPSVPSPHPGGTRKSTHQHGFGLAPFPKDPCASVSRNASCPWFQERNCRKASYTAIPTAVDRFRLRTLSVRIGILRAHSQWVSSKSFGRPADSGPKTRQSPAR